MSREFFRKVADKQHIKLTYITHFYCNQQDISEVINLLREYESMPASVLDYVQFVIVDDCSPLEYEIPEFDLNLTWLRITTDIPWNRVVPVIWGDLCGVRQNSDDRPGSCPAGFDVYLSD